MIKIVATLCSLAAPQDCYEHTVLAAEIGTVSMMDCMTGRALAEWMKGYPDERLAGWRCFIGDKARGI